MVENHKYDQHIQSSTEEKEVGPASRGGRDRLAYPNHIQKPKCHSHHAITQANFGKKEHLQATGIAACAWARHGCFYLQSVVDFQKGERLVLLKINHNRKSQKFTDR